MVIFTPLPLSFFLCIKIHFTLFLRNSLLKLVMAWGHKQIYIDIHICRSGDPDGKRSTPPSTRNIRGYKCVAIPLGIGSLGIRGIGSLGRVWHFNT